jgi:hypothetical protein
MPFVPKNKQHGTRTPIAHRSCGESNLHSNDQSKPPSCPAPNRQSSLQLKLVDEFCFL